MLCRNIWQTSHCNHSKSFTAIIEIISLQGLEINFICLKFYGNRNILLLKTICFVNTGMNHLKNETIAERVR